MLRKLLMTTLLAQAFTGVALAQDADHMSPFDPSVQDLTKRDEPPMLGIHWSRELAGSRAARTSRSPLMTYHGGKILPSSTVKAIFWGATWASNPGDKLAGIDLFYGGYGGSNYAKTTTEFTGSNGSVGAASAYQGHVIDVSTAASGASTSAILAQVCKQVSAGNIVVEPSGNGYYPVYTDLPRGNAGYCAYHSTGSCGGKPLQFAFFWKLDGDSGCDPADSSGQHSQGLSAIANVSAHELAEAVTDPANPGAWYDASGSENGDKCAWTFGGPLATFSNGSKWKVQGEWSNAAYNASTGYPNSSGQRGCLGGL